VRSRIVSSIRTFLWFAFHCEQEQLMTKTLRFLSLAALLATGTATATLAAGDDSGGSKGPQSVTGTQLGSQQTNKPAVDNTVTTRDGQYSTTTPATPRTGSAANTGMSAQSTGPAYPGVVGPTGSTQPDATNPGRSSPSGGGGHDNGGGAGSGSGSR